MTGLDTNVLVRYLANDDSAQTPVAQQLINSFTSQEPGFIPLVSLVETVWVLTGVLGYNKTETARAVQILLEAEDVRVQESDLVWRSLRQFRVSNADFADCVIGALGTDAGCEATVTFDRQAAKLPGFRLLSARKPH